MDITSYTSSTIRYELQPLRFWGVDIWSLKLEVRAGLNPVVGCSNNTICYQETDQNHWNNPSALKQPQFAYFFSIYKKYLTFLIKKGYNSNELVERPGKRSVT